MAKPFNELSPEEEREYIDKMIKETDDFPPAGTKWYILSTKWWNDWKAFTSGTGDHPGAINSEDILQPASSHLVDNLSADDYTNTIVKTGLQIEVDWTMVSPSIYDLLKSKYGLSGREILRYSVQANEFETKVEVTLRPISITWIPPRGEDVKLHEVMTMHISNKAGLGEVRDKVLKFYNQQSGYDTLEDVNYTRLWKLKPTLNHAKLQTWLNENQSMTNDAVFHSFPGFTLDHTCKLADIDLGYEDIMVMETKTGDLKWRFIKPLEQSP